jgi:hypothetical protein
MRKEPERDMEKSYASRIIKHIKEIKAEAFWDMKPSSVIECIRRDQQYALIVPLLYSTYWLLHVSAVAYHHHGAF